MCFPSHPEVLPLQDESATPWPPNSHSPAALTNTVAYAGLGLHPQHLCRRAITQSHLLPLHLETEINSKQRRQSRRCQACFPDSHGAALLPPQASLSLAEVTLRKQSLRSLSPWPPQLVAETLASSSLPQQLSSTSQQLSNLKAELNLSPLRLQQTTQAVFQGPWAESSYLMGRADFNAACSSFVQ